MKTDGFANWGKVSHTAWVFKEFFELDVQVAALFDRDYRSDEEVSEFKSSMTGSGVTFFVLPCKEIENVLLEPRAIRRVVRKYSQEELDDDQLDNIDAEFDRLISEARDQVFGQRMGHFIQYQLSKKPKADTPTLSSDFQRTFSEEWKSEKFRRKVVLGKAVFSAMAKHVQGNYKVSLTPRRVLGALEAAEIDTEVQSIVSELKAIFGGDK